MHRQTVALLAGVAGVVLGTLVITEANARIINVPGDAKKIQKAIDKAQSGDTVQVAAGKYRENIDFSGKDIYLSSLEGLEETTIEGRHRGLPVITISDFPSLGSAVRGFTVKSKSAQPAVLCFNSSPAILYNKISPTKSEEDRGAAILIDGPRSGPRIVGNVFEGNRGPAIQGGSIGPAIIDSNAFLDNSAHRGAALYISKGNGVSVRWNVVFDNVATDCAMFWFARVSELTIDHNTIAFNNSGSRGAVSFTGCNEVTFTNCIVANDIGRYAVYWEGIGSIRADYIDVSGTGIRVNYQGLQPGPNCMSKNAKFCDVRSRDFSLDRYSPCVGAGEHGTNIGALGIGCESARARWPQPQATPSDTGPPERGQPLPDHFVPFEQKPIVVFCPEAVYPSEAKRQGKSGVVWLKALVGPDGTVLEASIVKVSAAHVGFEEAALEAAYKYRYKPAIQGGNPVACWVTYKLEFNLPE